MKNNEDIHTLLISNGYTKDLSGIYKSDDNKGYWSNLDKDENKLFVKLLKEYAKALNMERKKKSPNQK